MKILSTLLLLVAALLTATTIAAKESTMRCEATREDALGPMYKPDAPLRTAVGEGYLLSGVVRSSADCAPVAAARIELWLTGVDGSYDDDHRATLISAASGAYRFASNYPSPYPGRPPHIHIRVTAPGFQTLITQHYPTPAATAADLDLVLRPAQ